MCTIENIITSMYCRNKNKVSGHTGKWRRFKIFLAKLFISTQKLKKVPPIIFFGSLVVSDIQIVDTISGTPCIVRLISAYQWFYLETVLAMTTIVIWKETKLSTKGELVKMISNFFFSKLFWSFTYVCADVQEAADCRSIFPADCS